MHNQPEFFVRGVRGPIGSGKTVGSCQEIFRVASNQVVWNGARTSRWALIRNTYGELLTTTLKTWMDWFEDTTHVVYSHPIQGLCSTILPDNTRLFLELWFIALDKPQDVKKLKSLELTGAFLNEASEIPKAVLDMCTGRVNRYPMKERGGFNWSGILMDTNSMDDDHWWCNLAEDEKPDNYQFYTQPPALLRTEKEEFDRLYSGGHRPKHALVKEGRKFYYYHPNPVAENVTNHVKGYDYWLLQVPGKDAMWRHIFILNRYGTVTDGVPVYDEYDDEMHCVPDIPLLKNHAIWWGWDFGLTPAFIIGQVVKGQLRLVDELYVPKHAQMGIRQFSTYVVKPHIEKHYKHWVDLHKADGSMVLSTGDYAGTAKSQNDEVTCISILNEVFADMGVVTIPSITNDLVPRTESVNKFLIDYTPDGDPSFQIDKKCKHTRKGLRGRYYYKRMNLSGRAGDERYNEKPFKNIYSHIQDAVQYLAMTAYEYVYQEKPTKTVFDRRLDELEKGTGDDKFKALALREHNKTMEHIYQNRGEVFDTVDM